MSEIAAGVGPAHGREKAASLTERLAHEVSILFGVGRHFGSQPAAKVSMTIMRAPQHGHGQDSTRSVLDMIKAAHLLGRALWCFGGFYLVATSARG